MARRLRQIFPALLALVLAGCGKATAPAADNPAGPRTTLLDGAGRSVSLPAAPVRIVSLSPAATDILLAEHAHAQIIGATRFCNLPPADEAHVTRLGGIVDPDYERLLALHPDLVVVPNIADHTVQDKTIALGLPVVVMNPEGLAGTIADLRLLGHASGHAAEGEMLAHAIESIRSLAADRLKDVPNEKRPRVLIILDDISPAPGSYVDDLLTAAGGRNVLPAGGKAWVQVPPEQMLQLAPDLVIFIPSSADSAPPNLPASLKTVTLLSGAPFYHPGPDLGSALWSLAHALYPARFPETTPPPG